MLLHKPVSKLTNAWLAEVPALLNDEPAYLKLRTDPLDYISIDSAQDVFSAVRWLRSTPGMYWAMVERGRKRGVEYTVDALRARWMNLFLDVVIPRDPEIRRRKTWSEQVWRLGSQKIQSRVFKRRYRLEIASGARLPTPRLEGGVQTLGQAPRR
jgi:hypothetical protein